MIVRVATPKDMPAVIELGRALHGESTYKDLCLDERKLFQAAGAMLQSGQFLCVAEQNGRIVGVMAGCCFPHWFSSDSVCSDLLLYVQPGARGSTAAFRLVNAYREWAAQSGAKLITVGVSAVSGEEQQKAVECYKASGFVPLGVTLKLGGADV